MSGPYRAHLAINSVRVRRPFGRDGRRTPVPFGRSFHRDGFRVHVVEPSHVFMHATSCRIEQPDWHNRVHVAWVRWIAVREPGDRFAYRYDIPLRPGDVVDVEYGSGLCGPPLVNPAYVDEPVGDCLCGKADGRSFCPRCDAALTVRVRERSAS